MQKIHFSILLIFCFCFKGTSQSWESVGGGTNNSSHGMLVWNDRLINLGSFNNPCNRVAEWDGVSWNCLGAGVGIVARAGTVWDGKLVVVGDFWNVQQPCVGCNGVAVWDGVSWSPLGNGVNNDVLSVTVWNNELVIAGDFTQADGVNVARIVKWNGNVWESVGPIGSFDNDIRAMVEFEGDLWVGGDFNNVGGQGPLDGLVKYDPSTSGWVGGNSGVDLIGGVNESVRVLYVNPNDGNLYMGGEFPELWDGDALAEDFNMSGIAMYDGSNWTPLGTGLNEYCRAMHEYNGDIIAGGYFTEAGGTPANKIAKWNGTNWAAMGAGFDAAGIDEYVKSAAIWDGIFFAGGAYTQAEGNSMNFISQWYEPATAPPVAWMSTSSTNLCGSGCINFLDNSTNAPTSWNWSFSGSDTPTSTTQNPGSVCWSSAGIYTVSLQACNAFGCTTQDIDIEVGSGPSVTVNDANICSGNSATLTAIPSDAGGSYLWSTGETTQSISVAPIDDANYTVTYTYIGCQSEPATSTVIVAPETGFNLSMDIDACENSSITYPDGTTQTITSSTSHTSNLLSESNCDSIVVTNVTMLNTYNQIENISICENNSFTYPDGVTEVITGNTVHISNLTSATNCDSIVTTNILVNPLPSINVSVSNNEITADQSGAQYIWLNCLNGNTVIDGETDQNYTPITNGNYAVEINLNGCVDTSACTNISSLALNEIDDNSVTIFPNPVGDYIHIQSMKVLSNISFELVDLNGKTILTGTLTEKYTIDVSHLERGVYILRFKNEEYGKNRFIKE